MGSKQHLDKDPNDPRNFPNADKLPSLKVVPEAEATPVEQFKVKDALSIQNVGWDPNDPRAN